MAGNSDENSVEPAAFVRNLLAAIGARAVGERVTENRDDNSMEQAAIGGKAADLVFGITRRKQE